MTSHAKKRPLPDVYGRKLEYAECHDLRKKLACSFHTQPDE